MNILCPDCHTSLKVEEGIRKVRCSSCGFEADASTLGTLPGAPLMLVVRDMSGEKLGSYQLESMIGAGGMGVVYKARDKRDDRYVAVKVLNPDYQWKQDEFVQRFKREIKALGRLDHPGIVRILDSGEEGGLHFLVTEFVDGMNLADVLKTGPMKLEDAVRIMTDVCEAINFAHKQGVVHRDIKPANIIIVGSKTKILDFGLAQVAFRESKITTLTRTNLAMGTFNYLSPEQRLNAKEVDHRADIFSLGVVFYEMLTGTLPLGSFALPSKVRGETPKRCDRIVTRSLQSSPDLRYPDALELSADVRRIIVGSRSPFLRPGTIAAVAASLAVIGGSAAAVLSPSSLPEDRQFSTDKAKVDAESQSKRATVQPKPIALSAPNSKAEDAQVQQQTPVKPNGMPPTQAASDILSGLATDNGSLGPKATVTASSDDAKKKRTKVTPMVSESIKKPTSVKAATYDVPKKAGVKKAAVSKAYSDKAQATKPGQADSFDADFGDVKEKKDSSLKSVSKSKKTIDKAEEK
jgi:LSD1 subclass zinc finger protein